MNTFLPFSNFTRSARVLDNLRLGKQIIEAGQILRALQVEDYGWKDHPGTKMWTGYEFSLYHYAICCAHEWKKRRGNVHGAMVRIIKEFGVEGEITNVYGDAFEWRNPYWLGDEAFHRSHQSNLKRKDPLWYAGYFDKEVPYDLDYIWPPPRIVQKEAV